MATTCQAALSGLSAGNRRQSQTAAYCQVPKLLHRQPGLRRHAVIPMTTGRPLRRCGAVLTALLLLLSTRCVPAAAVSGGKHRRQHGSARHLHQAALAVADPEAASTSATPPAPSGPPALSAAAQAADDDPVAASGVCPDAAACAPSVQCAMMWLIRLKLGHKIPEELDVRMLHKLWCCLVQSLRMMPTTLPMMSARPLLPS